MLPDIERNVFLRKIGTDSYPWQLKGIEPYTKNRWIYEANVTALLICVQPMPKHKQWQSQYIGCRLSTQETSSTYLLLARRFLRPYRIVTLMTPLLHPTPKNGTFDGTCFSFATFSMPYSNAYKVRWHHVMPDPVMKWSSSRKASLEATELSPGSILVRVMWHFLTSVQFLSFTFP